jgi:hypothetical protein
MINDPVILNKFSKYGFNMACLECRKKLTKQELNKSAGLFDLKLCDAHRSRMEKLIASQNIPAETILLYYQLKSQGIQSMLAWWDGKKQIDLAISRAKLNITIEQHNDNPVLYSDLAESFKAYSTIRENEFTHLRLHDFQIKSYPEETVQQIRQLLEEIRFQYKLT